MFFSLEIHPIIVDGNNREVLVGRIAVLEEGEDGLISKKVAEQTEMVKVIKEEVAVVMKDSKVDLDIRTTLGTIKEIIKGGVVVEVRTCT